MDRMTVWHNPHPTFRDHPVPVDHVRRWFLPVAMVPGDNLDEAFGRTNSVYGPWTEDPGVTLLPDVEGRGRSTSVGDVIEKADGTFWLVKSFGFEELTAL